jgi:hypothetical protein
MLSRRFLRYSLCGLFLAALGPAAKADIIYTLLGTPLSVNYDLNGVQLNFLTGAHASTGISGWDFNPYFSGEGLTFTANADSSHPIVGAIVGTGFETSALSPGTVINGSSSYVNNVLTGRDVPYNAAATDANFNVAGQEYMGIRFWNENTSSINYGWVLLSTGHSSNVSTYGWPAAIVAYAYDNTGASISVGAVPEPASALLSAIGGACCLGFRRRRRS